MPTYEHIKIADDNSFPGRGGTALDTRYQTEISATQFGAKGDGVADDTVALNSFLDYITLNKKSGVMPGTNYRITGTLIIPSRPGWTLRGNGNRATLITQDTDNIPVIQLGNTDGVALNHFRLEKFWITYKNYQPDTNTNAIGIHHYDMAWEGVFEDIGFKRGYYGSVVRAGIGMPWGTSWDNIHFGDDLSGGAMDWSAGLNAVPNNSFGRFFVEIGPMSKTIFILRGYNFTWDTVEFIQADVDTPKLFSFMNGTKLRFGTFKVENSPLTVGKQLIDVAGGSYIEFGHVSWNGGGLGTANLTSGTTYLFALGAGSSLDAHVRVGSMEVYLAADTVSPMYVYRNGTPTSLDASLEVDRIRMSNGWKLTNNASNATASESITVKEWVNDKVARRGNADYLVTLRDQNINLFPTAFTASRTITLPSDGNNIHNGLYYEFVFDGSINGTNYAIIRASTTTLHTVTDDKVKLRYTWQRASATASAGWILTHYETLPGGKPILTSDNGTKFKLSITNEGAITATSI